jgi:nucleoside-diphosphate-sugar epimerase
MSIILVTGGAGFVGRFIVEGLLARGDEVVVTGRTPPADAFFSRPVRFIPASLEPEEIDATIFNGIDHVVHAAFDHVEGKYRGGEGTDPEGFVRRNLHGSAALFEAARAAGLRRLVFLSSRAVYGMKPEGETLFETTEPEPETLYGQVKLDAERALLAMAGEGFQPVVLRVTGVYGFSGPGRDHKWSGLIRNLAGGMAIMGRAGSEVHGDDVADAVVLVMDADRSAMPDPVFNVSDLVVDRAEIAALVAERTGKVLPACPRFIASGLNVMDTSRLRGLGWQPGGREKLRSTVRAMTDAAVGDQ